jgi:hypothetical protein
MQNPTSSCSNVNDVKTGNYFDETRLALVLAVDFDAVVKGTYGVQGAAGKKDAVGGYKIDQACPTVGDDGLHGVLGHVVA